MGRRTKLISLKEVFGVIKDKVSLSKAAILSKPNNQSMHLAILRATTHEISTPPNQKHINMILSYGHSSRNTASTCIDALMVRLHNTHNSFVVFKCLIIIHYIIKRGSFILQDQLSVYPFVGGRNYLNLSNFRDNSTPESWNLSFWIRWYARYLETLLSTSTTMGFFLTSSSMDKDDERVEKISSLLNKDLLRELDVLVNLHEEICKAPELLNVQANQLVYGTMNLVEEDKCFAQREIMIRVNELEERIGHLSFADSVELVCVLKRLEICKEKLLLLFLNKKGSLGITIWDSIDELKEKIGESKDMCQRRFVKTGRRFGVSESARFGERVLRQDDSIRFASGRMSLMPILETVKSIS
ncbi:ENTH/ANTH/VHS superfamily protein [Thalictrum thalictroides]|uniref:ENTH/ANTH/VHS superfamily protein n=1 Tax=Thalictrum thalictroides TaxID=46969 RepID=A0A7J6WN36_THATH|nr:ENTH/ANTH/VHS superfamily protein [Thalictrum thalictroides]